MSRCINGPEFGVYYIKSIYLMSTRGINFVKNFHKSAKIPHLQMWLRSWMHNTKNNRDKLQHS